MLMRLKKLLQDDQIRPLDYYFAELISRIAKQQIEAPLEQDVVVFCAAFTSYELGQGNVCLDLDQLDKLFSLGGPLYGQQFQDWTLPPVAQWPELLTNSIAVGANKPLVFELNRVYLARYHQFELSIARRFGQPLNYQVDPRLPQALNQLFPAAPNQLKESEIDWQKVAVAVAASAPFAVISGGPGTGKTTTVTKLLALLIMQAQQRGETLDIRLAAPTGKAAARLTASITGALSQLTLPNQVAKAIPVQASTLHRLLGVLPGRSEFRHHQGHLLHLDVLVVDEASMVDLSLMARLLAALPSNAKLILLGDKDQLASVEAGSVLGDICSLVEQGYSHARCQQLTALTGFNLGEASNKGQLSTVADSLCQLQKSYRFHQQSGIGYLARAVNAGQSARIAPLWSKYQDIVRFELEQITALQQIVAEGYGEYLQWVAALPAGESPQPDAVRAILTAFNRFKLLAALREGPYGVTGLNELVAQWLRLPIEKAPTTASLSEPTVAPWYSGRPIMITANDHQAGLYNGDIGMCLVNENGDHRVYFELADGKVHHFLPSRLPAHQTVFAMTVHKSQGSEFDHTVMVLPDAMSPVLTRELIYTGITRAKQRLTLFAPETILNQAVRAKTLRASGLSYRLANPNMESSCEFI
ncbi:exodeoxyribonuclease V subunit alpha [Motilimonas eburnea]|uniref:exodeoxyribonuclease V subunit alpha n=1 Tax=Motilimonas eburnea TaxID=1737488 RepID=UPI001E4655BF|nr:exodeoxyribonuclease V subunit alpha [Motilimonas eburnea]MCE2573627.1 exodeoxyribonuclease V subunit alpha [Motilimonas eburnea]